MASMGGVQDVRSGTRCARAAPPVLTPAARGSRIDVTRTAPTRRRTTLAAAVAAAAALTISAAAPALSAPGNGNGNGQSSASQGQARSNDLSTTRGNQVNDAAALAPHLLDQELAWEACDFGSPALNTRFGAIPGTACADVTVPRDWKDPQDGHTITVRVTKTETSKGNPDRQGIALVNPGGPGGSGLPWGPAMAERAPELAEQYDFIGFDPRGVGQSTALECTYTPNPEHDIWQDTKAQVDACLENELTPYITTEQTVYDMDFIRAVMGEEKTSYIGYSYGTWLGSWYQRVFPQHAHRFLLDSAVDISRDGLQTTWDLQPRSRDRQFQDAMLSYVARQDAVYGLGTDPMEIRQRWEDAGGTRTMLGQIVAGSYLLPAMYSTSQYPMAASMIAAFISIMEAEAAATDEAGMQAQLERITAEARATVPAADRAAFDRFIEQGSEVVAERDELAAAVRTGQPVTFSGTFSAIRCQDGQWNTSEGYWTSWVNDLGRKAPWIAAFMGPSECMYWPAQTSMPSQPGGKDTPSAVIVQSELDAATPYEGGHRAAGVLRNTSLISVDNEGTHGLFPYRTECVDAPIRDYFLTGEMPAEKSLCEAHPLPGETQTHQVAGTPTHKGDIKISMRTDAVREANRITLDAIERQLLDSRAVTPDVEAFLER